MALIKCPECGKEISDKAGSCPNCGYPLKYDSIKNSEIKQFVKENQTLVLNDLNIEHKNYAPMEFFCNAHYNDESNKKISVTFKIKEDEATKRCLNINENIRIKINDIFRDVIVDKIEVVDNSIELKEEYPDTELKQEKFPWGEKTVLRCYRATPIEIENLEYDQLRKETLIKKMCSIGKNLDSIKSDVSIIKGIILFTFILSILAGIFTACSIMD